MSTDYSEDALVEQPAIALFSQLGYDTANCFYEKVGVSDSTLGRETTEEVVLVPKLWSALQKLNPDLAGKRGNSEAINLAIEELTRDRGAMSLVQANREVYKLLKDGVKVAFENDEGEETDETVRIIDWNDPENNDFFLASQFWITSPSGIYKKRPDLIGFVNGLPLIFIELKKSHGKIEHAYKHNLKDYKTTIPQVFWFNALVILSNGSQAKVGSMTAGWEHFADWKQLLSEDHRFIFTLIQKFGVKPGEKYPKLSDRSDIIVMTDEAHRSQYDTLALNMRNALPNAAFIGFTGTPLMAGEEKTKEVFGDYVSIYNFQQSIEDGATYRCQTSKHGDA